MRTSCKKNGFSLTEMLVVVAIISLLATLSLPAIRSLRRSFESGSGTKNIINAALSTARAIAAKEQRYAGIRFELDFHDNQYMIFIIHDPESTNLSSGFRALDGQKPIKLPDDSRVIDMINRLVSDPETLRDTPLGFIHPPDFDESSPEAPDGQKFPTIRDTSCFSIIFSPTGKLAIHAVRVRNRDGIYKPDNSIPGKVSMDDIFNSPENILNYNVGMFLQDDDWPVYNSTGGSSAGRGSLGAELSRNKFYIYEKSHLDKLKDEDDMLNYLINLEPVFINQYTGTIVKSN